MAAILTVVSYNLHGFNQGAPGIIEIISKIKPDVFLNQEHWLTPDNLDKLNSLSSDYFMFGSSAMNMLFVLVPYMADLLAVQL
jgi:hypothetical protein